MTTTHWANVARCAELRMDALWADACAAKGNDWEPFHERRWREHESYMAAQYMARLVWRTRP
jgi:hypothetical protein